VRFIAYLDMMNLHSSGSTNNHHTSLACQMQ